MTDTPANEQHLTPKPLEEHVPGAWNFKEDPDRPTPRLDRLMQIAEPATFSTARLTLSPEAREALMATGIVWDPVFDCEPDEDQWRKLEDALLEVLTPPVRYVTGIAPTATATSEDLCFHCRRSARMAGDYLCSRCKLPAAQ